MADEPPLNPAALAERALADPDPAERLRAIAALRGELEELECDAVRSAVQDGSSWSDVARALGVSRQSVHKRFARRIEELRPARRRRAAPAGPRMVVTAQSRQAVRAARAAARALGHPQVLTSHLLLGLLADRDGPAAVALEAIGVTFDAALEAVADGGQRKRARRAPVPIAATTRAALEQALREARRLGHDHVGVEHLLLGIVRDGDGPAVEALAALGVSPVDLERCLGKVHMEAPFAPH